MKFSITAAFFLSIVAATLSSCAFSKCDNITHKGAIFLLDVSDPKLYSEIEHDLNQNLPGFMQRTGLASITPCEEFTLSFAHLSGKDALELSSQSISIRQTGQSIKEERRQASPAPLVSLVQKKITDYKTLTTDPEMTKKSNIINILFKAITHPARDAKTVILLFSDMTENNSVVN